MKHTPTEPIPDVSRGDAHGWVGRIVKDNSEHLGAVFADAIITPERAPINDWLPKHRIFKHGASTGAYDPEFFPPVKQVLEDITSYQYPRVVLKAGVQSGKTETMLSALLWSIDQDPCEVIFLCPRDTDKRAFLMEKIKPAIAGTPGLSKKLNLTVADTGKQRRDPSLVHNGGYHIRMRAAGSPMELASVGAKLLFADEVDKYPISVQTSGDPLTLLEGRAKNYYDSVMVIACSPTITWDEESQTGSLVEHAYLGSNQCVWECPCPHCGEYTHWKFDAHVMWDNNSKTKRTGTNTIHKPETAHIRCPKCAKRIKDTQRLEAMRAGRWRAKNPKSKEARGYTWSRLLFPLSSLSDLASEFIAAQESKETLRAFYNDSLAETFDDLGRQNLVATPDVIETKLDRLIEKPELVYATMGVDVQEDSIHCVTIGYDPANTPHVLSYRVFHGETKVSYQKEQEIEDNVFVKLREHLVEMHSREGTYPLNIHGVAIDTGHNASEVYEFIATCKYGYRTDCKRINYFAVKGAGDQFGARPFLPRQTRPKVMKAGTNIRVITDRSSVSAQLTQIPQVLLGVGQGKSELAGKIRYKQIKFCKTLPDTYWNALDSEKYVRSSSSNRYCWKHVKGKNDALDATVYAYGAHRILQQTLSSYYGEPDLVKVNKAMMNKYLAQPSS